jgi:hypothetical protein
VLTFNTEFGALICPAAAVSLLEGPSSELPLMWVVMNIVILGHLSSSTLYVALPPWGTTNEPIKELKDTSLQI